MANFKRQKLMVSSNSMLCNKASQRLNLNVIKNLEYDEKNRQDEHQRELMKHKLRLVREQNKDK